MIIVIAYALGAKYQYMDEHKEQNKRLQTFLEAANARYKTLKWSISHDLFWISIVNNESHLSNKQKA
jgi:hypothetical protein